MVGGELHEDLDEALSKGSLGVTPPFPALELHVSGDAFGNKLQEAYLSDAAALKAAVMVGETGEGNASLQHILTVTCLHGILKDDKASCSLAHK